ncbi:GspH/FimT family pseudopilin [Chitinivorax sp. B]|uniref:GspH/FimT family pseudopilin n=1 Tax=Chitinivorax sp. B TaxID=2502235 RepID=UPI0010FA47ED
MLVRVRGFTILELMITIAIVAVVTMLVLPEASVWLSNSKTRTVAESYQNGLQMARNEAIKRNLPIRFEVLNTGGWQIRLEESGQVIQRDVASTDASIKFSVASGNGKTYVVYSGLGSLWAPEQANAIDQLNITSTTIAADKRVPLRLTISNPSGAVRMCLPSSSLPTGDPRKC